MYRMIAAMPIGRAPLLCQPPVRQTRCKRLFQDECSVCNKLKRGGNANSAGSGPCQTVLTAARRQSIAGQCAKAVWLGLCAAAIRRSRSSYIAYVDYQYKAIFRHCKSESINLAIVFNCLFITISLDKAGFPSNRGEISVSCITPLNNALPPAAAASPRNSRRAVSRWLRTCGPRLVETRNTARARARCA